MTLEDQFGVFVNYSGDSYVRRGTLACLSMPNGAGERYEFVVQSRGGRTIRRYLRLDRCSDWRVKYAAPRFRRAGLLFPDRVRAEEWLARWRSPSITPDPPAEQ